MSPLQTITFLAALRDSFLRKTVYFIVASFVSHIVLESSFLDHYSIITLRSDSDFVVTAEIAHIRKVYMITIITSANEVAHIT